MRFQILRDLQHIFHKNLSPFLYNYPNKDFWQIVSEVKNDVVIGLDAHNPNVYDDKENLERAKKYLKSLNITPLDKIEL